MAFLKKSMIVLMLLIFVLSIMQGVLAESDSVLDNSGEVEIDEDSETDEEDKPELRNGLKKARARVGIAKEKVVAARERYSLTKRKYSEAKEVYKTHKNRLVELKGKTKNCDENGCEEKRVELKKGVLKHLVKTSELIERSLEKLINRLDHAPISDEEKAEALETLTEMEIKVTEHKEKIEALSETASNDELREAIADLKQIWKEVRKTQKRVITSLTNAKLDHLVEKHKEYDNGMSLRIEQLREHGVDVARLEGLQRQFQNHIEVLEKDHATANELWVQIKEGKDVFKQWHDAQSKVRKDLKESQKLLRQFLSVYRDLKPLGESE